MNNSINRIYRRETKIDDKNKRKKGGNFNYTHFLIARNIARIYAYHLKRLSPMVCTHARGCARLIVSAMKYQQDHR